MNTAGAVTRPQRLQYLDGLRILAMLGVFIYHCARAFDDEGWHVKNAVGADTFTLLTDTLGHWLMPLFFVISGWVTYVVLTRASVGRFAWSRLTRLMIPFILGTLILVPPQVYIERVTQAGVTQGYFEWFPSYFDGFYALGGNFAWMGLHLWYLAMLFIFSMLFLPLFLLARGPARQTILPGWVLILFAGAVLFGLEYVLNQHQDTWGLTDFGGWSPFSYMVWFIIGHEIGRSERIQQAIASLAWISALIALIALASTMAVHYGLVPFPGYTARIALRAILAWSGIVAMLGLSAKFLANPNAFFVFINRYVLQIYILHQTVIVLVVFWLLGWAADPHVKYLAILTGAAFLTIAGLVAYNIAKAQILGRFRPQSARPPVSHS